MYKEQKQHCDTAEILITITSAILLDMNKRRFHSIAEYNGIKPTNQESLNNLSSTSENVA